MLPIESLEQRMATVMRIGLRKAMAYVDVVDINNPLREVKASLESVLHNELRNQITITYAEGYIHGGHLIRKNAPQGILLTAATELLREDPRIIKATKAVIYSLGGNISTHQNEIQAIIRTQFERGATVPMIAKRLGGYFDDNRVASIRFARTLTNDIYNRAHLDRYEDSGIVDGVEYSAHIDARTSDVCRMYNGTIWGLDDPDIKVPPLHFNCLVAGTKIITEDGLKSIEHVKVGELVLTSKYRYMPVSVIMNRESHELIELCTNKRSLFITPNHPIFVYNSWLNPDGQYKVGWFVASKINVGDEITCLDKVGNETHSETITQTIQLSWKCERVFNLSVLHDETYYANGILVHNCRSALNPYWGGIPGERNFVSEFGSEFVDGANNTADVFRSNYWVPMPRTKASATLQRAYFDKRDLLTIKDGVNLLMKAQRKTMHPDIIPLTTLKDRVRYRITDIDPSTIADAFGKSLMLDRFERTTIKDSISALIRDSELRRDRNLKKGLDSIAGRDQDKIDSYRAMLLRLK